MVAGPYLYRVQPETDGLNFTAVDHEGSSARTDMLQGDGFVAGYQLVGGKVLMTTKSASGWFTAEIAKNLRDMATNGDDILYYGASEFGYIGIAAGEVLYDSYQKHDFTIVKG